MHVHLQSYRMHQFMLDNLCNLYFISVIEMFVKVTPQHINNKKDDGYTMLQLAALSGNIYVVNALAASVSYTGMSKNAAIPLSV